MVPWFRPSSNGQCTLLSCGKCGCCWCACGQLAVSGSTLTDNFLSHGFPRMNVETVLLHGKPRSFRAEYRSWLEYFSNIWIPITLEKQFARFTRLFLYFLSIFNLGTSHPVLDFGRLTQGKGGSSAGVGVYIYRILFWYVLVTSIFCTGSRHFLFQTFRDSWPRCSRNLAVAASFCMHLQAAHWTWQFLKTWNFRPCCGPFGSAPMYSTGGFRRCWLELHTWRYEFKEGGHKCGTQKHKFPFHTKPPPWISTTLWHCTTEGSLWLVQNWIGKCPSRWGPWNVGNIGNAEGAGGQINMSDDFANLIWVSAIRLVRLPSTRELPYVRIGVDSDHLILFPIERHPQN